MRLYGRQIDLQELQVRQKKCVYNPSKINKVIIIIIKGLLPTPELALFPPFLTSHRRSRNHYFVIIIIVIISAWTTTIRSSCHGLLVGWLVVFVWIRKPNGLNMSNDKEANEVQVTQKWGHRWKENIGTEGSQQRKKRKEGKKKNKGEKEEKSWSRREESF